MHKHWRKNALTSCMCNIKAPIKLQSSNNINNSGEIILKIIKMSNSKKMIIKLTE